MSQKNRHGRREFLLGLSASLAASGISSAEGTSKNSEVDLETATLPTVLLGKHRVTRLIAGWNPIGGYSYLGPNMDRHMREYFTVDRTVEFLQSCKKKGINAHQFDPTEKMVKALQQVRESGTDMHFICLHSESSRHGSPEEVVRKTAPIALAHHGGVTDKLFREGKSERVHDYVKKAHDLGLLAGVSSHSPDNIKRIADEGWENDFFMTCFYYVNRYTDHPELLPEKKTVGKGFRASDPVTLTALVRQIEKPCLGFKILAAGRAPFRKEGVEEAFAFAFRNIKPTDGVIVGMYPRFQDEISLDADLTRKYGAISPMPT
jgi:hypothetical protein